MFSINTSSLRGAAERVPCRPGLNHAGFELHDVNVKPTAGTNLCLCTCSSSTQVVPGSVFILLELHRELRKGLERDLKKVHREVFMETSR